MNEQLFSCPHKTHVYQITYSVAGQEKTYELCSECARLECFSKFIVIKKTLESKTTTSVHKAGALN